MKIVHMIRNVIVLKRNHFLKYNDIIFKIILQREKDRSTNKTLINRLLQTLLSISVRKSFNLIRDNILMYCEIKKGNVLSFHALYTIGLTIKDILYYWLSCLYVWMPNHLYFIRFQINTKWQLQKRQVLRRPRPLRPLNVSAY